MKLHLLSIQYFQTSIKHCMTVLHIISGHNMNYMIIDINQINTLNSLQHLLLSSRFTTVQSGCIALNAFYSELVTLLQLPYKTLMPFLLQNSFI